MIINIYEAGDSWFLQYMADAIKKYVDKSIQIRSIYYKDAMVYPDGINFFCNMGIYEVYLHNNDVHPTIRDVIMTTHIEKWRPWNIKYKKVYYLPVTLIAFCRKWYDFFIRNGIYPAAIAIPGVDKEFFSIEPEHVKKDKLTIALIGRLYQSGRKGEKWFMPLLKQVGKKFNWMIIGDRWNLSFESSFFRQYDIRYYKTPSRREYYKLFEEIDIFLSLSKIEGGPMPLIESMAAGVIPVVSNTGFAKEVITNGKNGFVYPVGKIKTLVEILSFLSGEELGKYRQLAKQAAKPYTWESFVSKVTKVIRDVDKELVQSKF